MCELQKLAAWGLFSTQRQMRGLCYKVTAREKKQDAEEDLDKFVHCNVDSWFQLFQILCTDDIFYALMVMLLHMFEEISAGFIYLSFFFNSLVIFKGRHLSL